MHRLFGIETEYGIVVDGLGANDWINESIALVRSHAGRAAGGWNYRGEDPRRDMRGFTVHQLSHLFRPRHARKIAGGRVGQPEAPTPKLLPEQAH